ncbi:MAG: hypothetical protein J3Q66DRAFT_437779 [Benniella sp.]|nr:MAG: hypothetical protein J3Q66DRAFT_437779 [Benniella sp.]
MLIKNIILTLAVASIAYADIIPRTAPNPEGCKDGYRLKKGCGKDGADICCPVKIGRHSSINVDVGIDISTGVDGCDCGDKVKTKCKGCGGDDEDKCRDKCKGKGKDKDCIAPEPSKCPAAYFACPADYGGNCCPDDSFCGTDEGRFVCYT